MNSTLSKGALVSFLMHLLLASAVAQNKADKVFELMNRYYDYGQFNGSVLVAEQGAVLFKQGFGYANMEWDIPNLPDTKFRLGSITKQFTAMLIMQQVERGNIDLQANISDYLPNYPKGPGEKISVHHLLTHTSGIPNYTSFPGFMQEQSRESYDPKDFVKIFADSTLEFEPGERFSYSNSGYFLLGVIIEEVTGRSYEQCLHEDIFGPLNMSNTGYDHFNTILSKRASGYEKKGGGYENADYLDMTIPYAAGSMYSTVEDLFIWDKALYTEQLLSSEYRDLLFEPYAPAWGAHSYGYGWGVGMEAIGKDGDSLLVIGHGGGINGFNTDIKRIPVDKNTIILFNNTGGAALSEMSDRIAAILYDRPYEMPKRSAAMELMEVLMNKGMAAGLDRFETMNVSEEYSVDEVEMNMVGYQLLRAEKVMEAIEVFKLNVKAFPDSGNVYDSLGEAYLVAGNKELAIQNYERSVQIDPDNVNGKKILEELRSE